MDEEPDEQLVLFEDPHLLSVYPHDREQPVYENSGWPVEREDYEDDRELC